MLQQELIALDQHLVSVQGTEGGLAEELERSMALWEVETRDEVKWTIQRESGEFPQDFH
jgi:hypothetical protein